MKQKWVQRKFEFDFPASEYINFLRFLKQAPAIVEALTYSTPKEFLTKQDGDTWSIQENAGHLLSVDSLFIGRLDDYLANAEVLRAADVSGGRTNRADYNSKNINDIVEKFKLIRKEYISRLEQLEPEDFEKVAHHPRLDKPMRLCDMLHFQKEHDKHHINRIEELKTLWQS
jgi:hypothetical protein